MNRNIRLMLPALLLFFSCQSTGQEKHHELLEAKTFSEQLNADPQAVILDVRTPKEFAEGHIANAINVDWNGTAFDAGVAGLDKSRPLYVYCLGGGRSAAATEQMQQLGFQNIYELKGGMMSWRAEKLPETGLSQAKEGGMTETEFRELTKDDRLVLVDFYADWCAPCKKMAPFLDEIALEKSADVKVVRIDVTKNIGLSKALNVDELPTLMIIRNNAVVWTKTGFTEKEELLGHLK